MDLLSEIRAAFPAAPYPGDFILSKCWCEECAWSVSRLRGKSWKQLRVEDGVGGEGAYLSVHAFRYYLPGLLCLAVQHPDEAEMVACEINGRLIVSSLDKPAKIDEVQETASRLSLRQRGVVARFLIWLGDQGWQAPMLIEAGLKTVRDGQVVPYSSDELMRWCRSREASMKA